jgi:hypothetical protein
MNTEEITTVTYNFSDGSRVVQPINKQAMFDERKKKKTITQLWVLFQQTCWDKRAVSFVIDSEVNGVIKSEKEIHFSVLDKKLAKFQHKMNQKNVSIKSKKELIDFQKQLVNAVTHKRNLRMNIKCIQLT